MTKRRFFSDRKMWKIIAMDGEKDFDLEISFTERFRRTNKPDSNHTIHFKYATLAQFELFLDIERKTVKEEIEEEKKIEDLDSEIIDEEVNFYENLDGPTMAAMSYILHDLQTYSFVSRYEGSPIRELFEYHRKFSRSHRMFCQASNRVFHSFWEADPKTVAEKISDYLGPVAKKWAEDNPDHHAAYLALEEAEKKFLEEKERLEEADKYIWSIEPLRNDKYMLLFDREQEEKKRIKKALDLLVEREKEEKRRTKEILDLLPEREKERSSQPDQL